MAFFRKKFDDPLSQRAKELDKEISRIEAEIHRLKQLETSRLELRTSQNNHDNRRLFIEDRQEFLDDNQNSPSRKPSNDQPPSARYDLFGEIKKRLGFVKKSESEKTKLIQTLIAGSLQGPPLLKYEQRIARNRFLLLFTIFIFLLIGIISLLTKAR